MNYIWEFFINILETLLFVLLINNRLPKKAMSMYYFKQAFAFIFITGFMLLLNINHASSIFVVLLMFTIHCIYTWIFCRQTIMTKLFWNILFTISTIIADACTTIIPTNLFHIEITDILSGGNLRIPFTLLYISILTVIILLLLCCSGENFELDIIEKIVFFGLSLLCIIIESFIVAGQANLYLHIETSYMKLLYILFFLVMMLFIALAIYVYHLGVERDKNIKLSNLQILSEMERKQYEQIISSIDELRYMKHDIHNHIETLNMLLKNGNIENAKSYLEDLSTSIAKSHTMLSSGNSTIDSILTNKFLQCKNTEIPVDYSIYLPENIPYSDIELCSLLGNLFDNAIEASIKIPDKQNRLICCQMKPYQSMLSICISNRTNEIVHMNRQHKLSSTKSVKYDPSHGLGLSRIKNIVDSHNGILDINYDADLFTVSILTPLSEEDSHEN